MHHNGMSRSLVVFPELWWEAWGSSLVVTVNWGKLLSCKKGVGPPIKLQGGTWDCSQVAAVVLASSWVEGLLVVFLELWLEAWGSSQVVTGIWGTLSCY